MPSKYSRDELRSMARRVLDGLNSDDHAERTKAEMTLVFTVAAAFIPEKLALQRIKELAKDDDGRRR